MIRPETFNITALWGSMGHCVMLMAVDSVPRLWGRKREKGESPQGEPRQCVAEEPWRVESGCCRDGERLLSDKVTASVDAEEDEQQDSEAP